MKSIVRSYFLLENDKKLEKMNLNNINLGNFKREIKYLVMLKLLFNSVKLYVVYCYE